MILDSTCYWRRWLDSSFLPLVVLTIGRLRETVGRDFDSENSFEAAKTSDSTCSKEW